MIPRLYPATSTSWETNGSPLADATTCTVKQGGGSSELTLVYPMSGLHFKDIKQRSIIMMKPDPYTREQPFRVYFVGKPINGMVTFRARHLAYDAAGIPVAPIEAFSAKDAANKIKANAMVSCPFTWSSNMNDVGSVLQTKTPASARALTLGSKNTWQGVFGGDLLYDRYEIKLLSNGGADRGVVFRYGVDLIDMQQEENISNVYTGIVPYYSGRGKNAAQVIGSVLQASGSYNFVRILPIDLTDYFEEVPTVAALNAAGQEYLQNNDIGTPEVSLSLSWDQLAGKEVHLYDTVGVEFEELGVSAKVRVCETEYDGLEEEYIGATVCSPRKTIADTIANAGKQISAIPTTTQMQQAIIDQTRLITGVKGGYIVYHFNSDGTPSEILIMDAANETEARKVLRINNLGIGFSTNGPNGPFETAWTINGQFNAKWITAGYLNVDRIEAGSIKTAKLDDGSVTNPKIGSSAVSYGKTSFTGILDQVGTNEQDIQTLFNYYNNLGNIYINGTNASATIQNLGVTSSLYFRGRYVQWKTIKDGDGNNQVVLAVIPEN